MIAARPWHFVVLAAALAYVFWAIFTPGTAGPGARQAPHGAQPLTATEVGPGSVSRSHHPDTVESSEGSPGTQRTTEDDPLAAVVDALVSGGVDQVLARLDKAELHLADLDDAARQRFTRMIVSRATPRQLRHLLSQGHVVLAEGAAVDAATRMIEVELGAADPGAIIDKLKILTAAGYSLADTRPMGVGEFNAFDMAVHQGLDEVVIYLGTLGLTPAMGDAVRQVCAGSGFCSPALDRRLSEMGY